MRHCSDARGRSPLPECGHLAGAAWRLCYGVSVLLSASCHQLHNLSFVTAVIGEVGVVPDSRGTRLYGDGARYMVPGHPLPNVGLWQEPQQLAGALIAVSTRMRVRRYLELGIYTAWSTCLISAYFTRVAAAARAASDWAAGWAAGWAAADWAAAVVAAVSTLSPSTSLPRWSMVPPARCSTFST